VPFVVGVYTNSGGEFFAVGVGRGIRPGPTDSPRARTQAPRSSSQAESLTRTKDLHCVPWLAGRSMPRRFNSSAAAFSMLQCAQSERGIHSVVVSHAGSLNAMCEAPVAPSWACREDRHPEVPHPAWRRLITSPIGDFSDGGGGLPHVSSAPSSRTRFSGEMVMLE
jgi:hypothetical protein